MTHAAAAHRADIAPVESAEEVAASPATRAVQDFASSDAMKILRDWVETAEVRAIRGSLKSTDSKS